jgi:hypothetical protein
MLQFFLFIFYVLGFSFLIWRFNFFKIKNIPTFFPVTAFLVKILAGIILTFIYTYYYPNRNTADIFKYFDDSKIMYEAFFSNFPDFIKMLSGIGNDSIYFNENYYDKMNWWYRQSVGNIYNDSHIIIRFNALIRFFSFGNFYVHTVFMCFLSFLGCIALYKAFSIFIKDKQKQLFFGIFFLPSVLFWSSGVLKEGLVIFTLGFLLFSFFSITELKNKMILNYIIILLSLLLLFYLKFYILASLIPALVAFFISKKNIPFNYILVFAVYIVFVLALPLFCKELNPLMLLKEKQGAFLELANTENAGSLLPAIALDGTLLSLVKNIPLALKNTIILPIFIFSKSSIELMAALENLFIQLFIIIAILHRKKITFIENNFVWMSISFSFFLFLLIGISTPILGAIVRYKTPALPLIIGVLLLLSDHSKLYNIKPYRYIYEKLETFFSRFNSF